MKALRNYLLPLVEEGVCLAFSGGVDSSLLLSICCDIGKKVNQKVHAVTFHTTLHPMGDVEIARTVARDLEAIHHVIEVDERRHVEIQNNPVDRCYRCKKYLFQCLQDYCQNLGICHIIEGTNYDDLSAYRPGIHALKELSVESPLADCQVTKAQVRQWAEDLGLPVAGRPSAPCLATRIPYDTPLDWTLLRHIDQGEIYLKELGFSTCRIRVHKEITRIEIPEEEFHRFITYQKEIVQTLKNLGFLYITLDLEGFRSGSMDLYLSERERECLCTSKRS